MIIAGRLSMSGGAAGRERRARGERAEKAAHIKVLESRVSARSDASISRRDRDIDVAVPVAERAIRELEGRAK